MSPRDATSRARPGVGTDVVLVAGLARRLADQPRLAEALFTPGERGRAARRRDPTTWLAGCFAAKEAFVKALGRGLNSAGPDAWLQEVEVDPGEDGAPVLVLGPRPSHALERRGVRAHLALSPAGGFAVATVLLLPETSPPSDERTR